MPYFIVTSTTDPIVLYDILKKTDPDGFSTKLEIDAENLPLILKTIMAGDKSYSDNIKNAISDIWNNDLLADEINRQIILLLSKGYKVRDIAGKVGLSSSGIQKRLNKIEKQFEVENEKDLIKKIFDDKLLVGIDM